MKKLIAVFLILSMALGLVACGGGNETPGTTDAPKGTFQVGFGREKIMPEAVIPLAGSGIQGREYEGILDILYTTCVALTDENGNTVLLFTNDLVNSKDELSDPAKEQVSKATGIAVENIMVAATHTHAAPTFTATYIDGVPQYKQLIMDSMTVAAKKAIADQSPAQISAGSTQAVGMAYSRHYTMFDGRIEKNFSKNDIPVGHPDEPNDTMQLVRFTREAEGKKDIIMMTFGIHPTFNGQAKDKMISADFVYPTRDYIETETGALVAYFTSSAGNQTGNSSIPGESPFDRTQYKEYGKALGKIAVDYLPNLQPLNAGQIRLEKKVFTADAYKDKIEMLPQAKTVYAEYTKTSEAAVQGMLEDYGFDSIWEVIAIIDRAEMDKTVDVALNALSIGELSMIFAPFEMFGDTAKYIMGNTPYDMTMIVTMANNGHGYFPTEKAYGYQVYEGFVAKVVPGTAEQIADTFVNMLKDMKG